MNTTWTHNCSFEIGTKGRDADDLRETRENTWIQWMDRHIHWLEQMEPILVEHHHHLLVPNFRNESTSVSLPYGFKLAARRNIRVGCFAPVLSDLSAPHANQNWTISINHINKSAEYSHTCTQFPVCTYTIPAPLYGFYNHIHFFCHHHLHLLFYLATLKTLL